MSEGEKAVTGAAGEGNPKHLSREPISISARSYWIGLTLLPISGGVAGFSVALLAGVDAKFGQPLATLLAGAGALSAGILAYVNGERSRGSSKVQHEERLDSERERHRIDLDRERERHREDSRHTKESALRDRYTAIATQIAHDSAAIRQAGVYALAALADDWHAFGEDDERQVCINLLQWYLRVPFPEGNDPEKPDLSEREIRQTIVALLAGRSRRRPEDPKSWAATLIGLDQVSLPNCYFLGFNFHQFDLSLANLRGAVLAGANLTQAYLGFADLTGADLTGARLTEAYLTDAKLVDTNLTRANLVRANLTNSRLPSAKLPRADLTRANLTSADLSGANLAKAKVTTADLTGADLTGADLTGADLSWVPLIEAQLGDSKLPSANLTRANLSGANLSYADLSDASLLRANLTGANLTGANPTGANLIYADLTDANLTKVIHTESTTWPTGFTPPIPPAEV
ncbi:pentapeptide repeat-containing protein [Nocardia asiatica]|uniref:pentapeptide repeat-containing protein n=1 Tax=Nocardia asiatica TaxID=209252 RepID=UPI0024555634|nr:pentapeptide repeat-containing protein [Nocardia asiatica]